MAYVLGDDPNKPVSLGACLLWGDRLAQAQEQPLVSLQVFTHAGSAGTLARQASLLCASGRAPALSVGVVKETAILAAVPDDLPSVPDLGPDVWALAGLFNESGARAVDDHGRLVAEVAGLEVARVVSPDGRPVVEVGVGQADRELHQLVHRDLPADAALRRAVAMVATHRRPGARLHPLNRIARERWLRSVLVDDPSIVGLAALEPVPPLEPRETVLGSVPVGALGIGASSDGHDQDGAEKVVVVCSVGVDLDLAAAAADYRSRHTDPQADAPRLIVVVPEADRYPATEQLLGYLDDTEVVSVRAPWATTPTD